MQTREFTMNFIGLDIRICYSVRGEHVRQTYFEPEQYPEISIDSIECEGGFLEVEDLFFRLNNGEHVSLEDMLAEEVHKDFIND